jgi:hypothetical protein
VSVKIEKKDYEMKRIYGLFLGFIVFFAFSCTSTYEVRSTNYNEITLETDKIIYINLPRNGRYKETIYRGSGQTYQELLEASMEYYASKLVLGKEYESKNDCINTARDSNANYLFYSTIINWEDRATVWSGIPDTLTIKFEVVNLENGETIYEAELLGIGKKDMSWWGIGASPEDLLPGLFAELIKKIF